MSLCRGMNGLGALCRGRRLQACIGHAWLHPAGGGCGGTGGADAAAMPCARSAPQRATSRCLATAAPAAGAPSGFGRGRAAASAGAAAADSSVASTSTSGGLHGLHGRAEDSGTAHGGASAGMPAHNAPGIKRRRTIGTLQSVPAVPQPQETLASAIKRASRVTPSAGIKNAAEKERNRAARQMDTLMKELSVPLTRYLAAFPAFERLHPFEQALLELTVGRDKYINVLSKVDSLRKSLQQTGKSLASKASKAPSKAGAQEVAAAGLEQLTSLYTSGASHVESLRSVARSLRSLPSLDPSLPTLALVGAPNVGKSSLVQLLSTGLPEVCNYPFTTRSIKMGHFYVDGAKHQVTDTPGLLNRADDERNKMELLTLATLQHLPSAVLFVADLTEECGTSAADQAAIRTELSTRFAGKPWLDVLSKRDVLGGVLADSAALSSAAARSGGSGGGDGEAGPAPLRCAVTRPAELAAALPSALAVSSLTEEGVPELKARIMAMLAAVYERREEVWEEGDDEGEDGAASLEDDEGAEEERARDPAHT